jgi:hypothetical protein
MDIKGALADLDAMDLFLDAVPYDQPVDLQLAQLEAVVLDELGRNPVEGPARMIVTAGYVARLIMSEHDLDRETINACSNEFVHMLTNRTRRSKF